MAECRRYSSVFPLLRCHQFPIIFFIGQVYLCIVFPYHRLCPSWPSLDTAVRVQHYARGFINSPSRHGGGATGPSHLGWVHRLAKPRSMPMDGRSLKKMSQTVTVLTLVFGSSESSTFSNNAIYEALPRHIFWCCEAFVPASHSSCRMSAPPETSTAPYGVVLNCVVRLSGPRQGLTVGKQAYRTVGKGASSQ